MKLPKVRGFTLIEMMIVVGIIAILLSLAVPAYGRYGFRARRAEGREMLVRVATAQERFFTNFNRYATTFAELGFGAAVAPCTVVGSSERCNYVIRIGGLGAASATYTLTAGPQLGQVTDQCGDLSLTNTGLKTFTGNQTNGNCW